MEKMKKGAVVKEVTKGAVKWFKMTGWELLKGNEKNHDKTDTKKTAAS